MPARHSPRAIQAPRRQRGMSLVEIMVAVLIGLIGMVVIFQMFALSESRKRTISAGSDMDVSGRLGLIALQRDVQLAGYGYGQAASPTATGSAPAMGCAVTAYDSGRPGGSQDFSFTLAPVSIAVGASGAPDTISVLQGSSNALVVGKTIDQSGTETKRIKADTGGRTGLEKGDVVVAVTASPSLACALIEITDNTNTDQMTLNHATGNYVNSAGQSRTARFNKSGGVAFTLTGDGKLYSLGPTPRLNIWSIVNNKLVVANGLGYVDANSDSANDTLETADGIINLKAQYGYDANNDGLIATSEWTTTAPTVWSRVLAVRVAILARGQFERNPVTTTAPSWTGGAFVMTDVDGTSDSNETGSANNWRHYRYNVYEAIIPLKNMIWGSKL